MTIEYRDEKSQKLQRIYADAVSDCADHSGCAAIECIENMMCDNEIKAVFSRKTEVEWRFDSCADNINGEVLNWTLLKVPKKFPNIKVTKFSPYVNREGKLISDIHFSRVEVAEKNHIKSDKGMFTADDMITAVRAQIRRDTARRKKDGLPPIHWKVFGITMAKKRPENVEVCTVDGIQSSFGFTYLVEEHELWNHLDANRHYSTGYRVDLKKAVRTKPRTNRGRNNYQRKSRSTYKRPKKLFQQMRQQNRWQKKIINEQRKKRR